MLDHPIIPPDTDRIAFREWSDDDLDAFQAICSDPRVMRYVGDGKTWSTERTGKFIHAAAEMFRQYGYCQWPLIYKADRKLIGYCGFVNAEAAVEIGWRLVPEYWGQGLATEAAGAALRHGIATLGFRRVIASVQAANVASIRVIEKLGMTLVESVDRAGRKVNVYAATSDDVMTLPPHLI